MGILGQIRRSILLHGCVVRLAEVENFERVPHGSCLIQHPVIVSKPRKHLLCSRGVDPFKASGETRDVVWIAWTGSIMSVGMKKTNRPIFDLLELCL